ncbi:MAG: FHA domain-containing protein [Planctomycetes bacterium]|nr:FHA domain-containing protein [Planctomycetota bacterium]
MPRLLVRCDGQEHTFELGDETVVVGRAAENTIQIRDIKASRRHCQIEKGPSGYKVVDLESANGTEVNAKKVNHCPLKDGDKITIGQVEILFAQPAEAPAPAAAPPPLPGKPPTQKMPKLDTPIAKMPTRRSVAPLGASGDGATPAGEVEAEARLARRSLKPTAVTQDQYEAQLFGKMKTAAIVLVLVGVLGVGAKSMMNDAARREAADTAYRTAWESEKSGKATDTLALYKAFVDQYPGAEKAAEAKGKIAKLEERIAVVEQAERDLVSVKVKLTSELADLAAIRAELEGIAAKVGTGPVAERARFELSAIEQRIAKRGESDYNSMVASAKKHLEEKDFAAALDQVKAFLASYPGSKYGARAQAELDGVLRAAADDYEGLVTAANKLLRERKFEAARKLLASRADRYAGTRHQFELQFKLYGIDLLARGADERNLDAKLREARRECFELALKADDMAKQRKFEEARAAYGRILARLEAPELSDLRSLFERRQKDILGEADLFQKLCASINGGSLKPATYQLTEEVAGTMLNANSEGFDVKFPNGGTRINWLSVTPPQMLGLYRRLELAANDVYYLAVFSFSNRLAKDAHRLLYDFSRLVPDKLADVNTCVAWGRGMEAPADGFVWHKDLWITKTELKYALLDDQLDLLITRIGRTDEKIVSDSFAEYGKLLAGADLTAEWKAAGQAKMLEAFEKKRENYVSDLQKSLKATGYDQLLALKRDLNTKRDLALKDIFDEVLYPYDAATNNHGEKGQPIVDEKVKAVKELWEHPENLVARLNKNVVVAVDQIKSADGYVVKLGGKALSETEELDRIMAQASGDINLQSVTIDAKEQSLLEYNKKVWAFNKSAKFDMNAGELKQIEITNEYREMMGLRILEAHDQLGKAARLHCEWMVSTGIFAHDEDRAETRSPGDRVKRQGYSGPCGENIAMGMGDAKGAFDAWYHSSGHHRNMLYAGKRGSSEGWNQLGVGNVGNHWCQDFGSSAGQASKGEAVKPPSSGDSGGAPAAPPAGNGAPAAPGNGAPPANGGGGKKHKGGNGR